MSRKILNDAVRLWGEKVQIEMLQEEATELALAARKLVRKGADEGLCDLADEIADVTILIDQMCLIFENLPKKISERRVFKLQRLADRIEARDFEKK